MSETFSCPACGAPLEYKLGMDFTFPCPYCGNSVIVPDNLRSQLSEPKEYQPDTTKYVDETAIFQKVHDLLMAGKKSEAIELYRYCYSDGLTSAKKVVDEIEAGTVTGLPKNQIDPSILNIYSSKTDEKKLLKKAYVYLVLISVAAVVLIGLMAFVLTAVFNTSSSKSIAIPTTRRPTSRPSPTRVPLATQVPQPTAIPDILTPVLRFGGEGNGPGKLANANNIVVTSDGLVYVGDLNLSRIEVFDAAGKFVTQWVLNQGEGYYHLAAGGPGSLYVNEGGHIYRYDRQTGERVSEIKYQDISGFQNGFGSMAALPNGDLAAAWIDENLPTDDILLFDSGGKLVNKITKAISGLADSGTENNLQLAADGVGNIYVLGVAAQTVVKYSPKGKFITRFGSYGTKPGQFNSETNIAINSQGMVFVFGNNNLVFDSGGLLIKSFDSTGIQFGATFDLEDNLYITNGVEVLKYTLGPLQ